MDWQTPPAIRFACTDCGKCCTGAPGAVRVTEEEISRLADLVGLERVNFCEKYVRDFPAGFASDEAVHSLPRWSLREQADGSCIFFREGRCSVYSARPAQCRAYPFWLKNLRNADAWRRTAEFCPGIGQGKLFEPDDVLRELEASPL